MVTTLRTAPVRVTPVPGRPWLRYLLVILLSLLLHLGAWQFRGYLEHRPDSLPKPKPPIEVSLVQAPGPMAETSPVAGPAPSQPQAEPAPKAAPAPKPIAKPLPPAPKPAAKPSAPTAAKTAPPVKSSPPARIEPKVEPAIPPKPAEPRPPKPRKPARREIEEDPNLPALTQPAEKSPEPPPPPRPMPRMDARTQRAERPGKLTDAPVQPPRETGGPGAPGELAGPASSSRSAASPRNPPASSRTPPPGAGAPTGGAYEGAKANAAYLHNPKPEYPNIAKRRQWQGRVILKVRVLADGRAASVSLEKSSGHEVLDEAALEAVRHWHFVPAKRGGKPVDSWVNVPINFNLLDSQ